MKFVQKSFDDNDQLGRDMLKAYLENRGHSVSDNENKYGIDLFSTKGEKTFWWEVEMKSGWPWTCFEDFKFDTVSFLGRKEKWSDIEFWYVIICKENGAALLCHSNVIFKDEYREKIFINTAQRKGTDTFYRVPKNYCIFVKPENFR